MANPEHVKILKQGVDVWNKWIQDKYDLHPDLSQMDLSYKSFKKIDLICGNLQNSNLSHISLREAHLSEAIIQYSDLSFADLNRINLCGADLYGTNLSGANLAGANLENTNLSKANLSYTDLWATNFNGANISDSDITNARLGKSSFCGTTLKNVKGLDTCLHLSSSLIDFLTFDLSGLLPITFLRGCGLPDHYIKNLPFLLNQPNDFYSCFISFSSKDKEFTERLHADLQDKGVRCWFAPEDMKIGEKIRYAIDGAIRMRDKLLLILSGDSINSRWVQTEVETAVEEEDRNKKTILIPIRIDNSVMDCNEPWAADIKRTRYIGDFTKWKEQYYYKNNFERLLRDLRLERTNEKAKASTTSENFLE